MLKSRHLDSGMADVLGGTCPYCSEVMHVGERVVQCPECATWYHVSCWTELDNQCAMHGCAGADEIEPEETLNTAGGSLLDEILLEFMADEVAEEQTDGTDDLLQNIEITPLEDEPGGEDIPSLELSLDDFVTELSAPPASSRQNQSTGSGTIYCPYCHTAVDVDRPAVICRRCHTPHHLDCWQEATKCSVLGCGSRQTAPYPSSGQTPLAGGVIDMTELADEAPSSNSNSTTSPGAGALQKESLLSRLKKWWSSQS